MGSKYPSSLSSWSPSWPWMAMRVRMYVSIYHLFSSDKCDCVWVQVPGRSETHIFPYQRAVFVRNLTKTRQAQNFFSPQLWPPASNLSFIGSGKAHCKLLLILPFKYECNEIKMNRVPNQKEEKRPLQTSLVDMVEKGKRTDLVCVLGPQYDSFVFLLFLFVAFRERESAGVGERGRGREQGRILSRFRAQCRA